jgi:lysozyme family protein
MADFQIAVTLTLHNEGGYEDNPNDPGGATNMGVEQRDLPDIDIRTLTVAQATAYYAQNYWKSYYSQIDSQAIANKLFDLGVLFGVQTAIKFLQSTLGISTDGVFGINTLEAVNSADAGLLQRYEDVMWQHAQGIAALNPAEAMFLIGWQRRILS